MFDKVPTMSPPKPKTLIFTGGINESISNLEMKEGECFDMINYEEVSGEFHGYRSVMGFERVDGTTVTITNPNIPGEDLEVSWPSSVPLVFTDPDDYTAIDDTTREDRRDNITAPPGVDYLKGAFDYNGDDFVIGYTASTGDHSLWLMSPSGWTAVSTFPTISEGAGVDSGVNYDILNCRMQYFPLTANDATPNDEIVILSNSISEAVVLWKNNSGDYHCTSLIEANSPEYPGATPVLPSDSTIDTGFPTMSAVFNQRLHISYPSGVLFVSHPGDPFAYDPAVTAGGAFWLGGEVTNLVVSPSSLTVFQEKGIDIIKALNTTGFNEGKETFSSLSGAVRGTAARILGKTLFCDERGVMYLESTDTYGDFDINNLSKKAQKTYQKNKDSIIGAVVDREKSQYLVYFEDGTGITITCEPNYRGDFSVRGVSLFSLGRRFTFVKEVTKKSKRYLLTDEDAYLRIQHQDASSFDGNEINSRFTTAFSPYGSAVSNKTFQRIMFELTATKGQVFTTRPLYDYQGSNIPKSDLYISDPQGNEPAIWGQSVWGTFVWGGTGAVNQEYSYINGIGVNMAIQFRCSSKHHTPHVVHNAIILYTMGAIKW